MDQAQDKLNNLLFYRKSFLPPTILDLNHYLNSSPTKLWRQTKSFPQRGIVRTVKNGELMPR